MSDLITPGIPDMGPMSASSEIANTFGLGDSLDTQLSTFTRNYPQAAEEAAELGMDIETYYLSIILGQNAGSSQQNFFQKVGSGIADVAKNKAGNVASIGKEAFSAGKNVAKGEFGAALDNAGNVVDKVVELPNFETRTDGPVGKPVYQEVMNAFNTEAITSGAINFGKNIVGSASSMGGKIADADAATVMDSGAAVGILRDDITGEGTFLGGANTLMADDETINYDTDTSGSNQGSSGMDSRLEGYYNILREQGPEAAAIYAENLGLFVEGVGSALFGAARQYTDEQLMSLGRSVGINDGSVPTIQEITQAGVVLDPSEERRVMDSLMGSQVAGGRQFDPAVAQSAIDMNQMMYNRRQPFITAGINASNIAPGIQFGGGIAATMEGALPSFADIFKMNQADIQNEFNQQLLASQESASDVNKILGTINAVSGAYESNLLGFKDLIDTTKENLGIGVKKNKFVVDEEYEYLDSLQNSYNEFTTTKG